MNKEKVMLKLAVSLHFIASFLFFIGIFVNGMSMVHFLASVIFALSGMKCIKKYKELE